MNFNRVFFEAWNRAQLVLGALAVALALWGRSRRTPVMLLVASLLLVVFTHWALEPQIVELGRELDFVPRNPPPPVWEAFQHYHSAYFLVETVRFGLVVLATLFLVVPAMRGQQTAE